jgi:epoxyqueuosine reductase
MSRNADEAWIVERAKAQGFDLCGIVRAEKFPELEKFKEWLRLGYAGEMKYLEDPRRTDPSLVIEDLRSAIVCALNYNTEHPYSTEAEGGAELAGGQPRGWISRYAWGDDYHKVMWSKLNALAEALKARFSEPFAARAYADTGPVAERVFAKYAGLGWLGKNTLLLNKAYGSWLFLGVILTSLDLPQSLEPAESPPPDLCGSCRRCLDACPTEALVAPYVLDARRCISYLTIELRESIPEEFRAPIGGQVYGCDICQDVCPYNRKAPVSPLKEFQPRQQGNEHSLMRPVLEGLANMDLEEFRERFQNSAAKRTKWTGLVRNACIALGNTATRTGPEDRSRVEALLSELARSEISTIAASADWSLRRIQQTPK